MMIVNWCKNAGKQINERRKNVVGWKSNLIRSIWHTSMHSTWVHGSRNDNLSRMLVCQNVDVKLSQYANIQNYTCFRIVKRKFFLSASSSSSLSVARLHSMMRCSILLILMRCLPNSGSHMSFVDLICITNKMPPKTMKYGARTHTSTANNTETHGKTHVPQRSQMNCWTNQFSSNKAVINRLWD